MKALVYKGPEIVELEDIPQPEPKGDESLIKIRTVGVCGSDFEGYLGKTGRRTPPMVMGHEISATVEVPAENSRFKKGDNVVVQPKLYCGQCDFCRQGLTNLCPGEHAPDRHHGNQYSGIVRLLGKEFSGQFSADRNRKNPAGSDHHIHRAARKWGSGFPESQSEQRRKTP